MKKKPGILVLGVVFIGLLVSGCSPSVEAISEAIVATMDSWTPVPTFTQPPTYTAAPTIAIEVTRIVEVTPTFTSTPRFTPTITNTPTTTSTPTRTPTITRTPNATQTKIARDLARLRSTKSNGFYLVNVDIAPGVWRSNGSGDSCYWSVTSSTGNIINNHFGMAGGTAYIPPTAFQVEFDDCGTWSFLSPP